MTNFQTDGVGNSITYKNSWKDRFSFVVIDICMFSHTDLPATWATFLPCYCLLNISHKYLTWAVLCLILFFVLQCVYVFFFKFFLLFFLNYVFFQFSDFPQFPTSLWVHPRIKVTFENQENLFHVFAFCNNTDFLNSLIASALSFFSYEIISMYKSSTNLLFKSLLPNFQYYAFPTSSLTFSIVTVNWLSLDILS